MLVPAVTGHAVLVVPVPGPVPEPLKGYVEPLRTVVLFSALGRRYLSPGRLMDMHFP